MAQNSEQRENRILDAAQRLIVQYGYHKTSVAEIARDAGVSKGAVYLHFRSKDQLLQQLVRREMMRYAEDWSRRVEADPEGGTIGGIYRHILAAMKANPLIHAIMVQDRQVIGHELHLSLDETVELRTDFVREMQSKGVVTEDADPRAVAYLMSSFVVGITTMDQLMPKEAVPSFGSLLSTFGKMADAYLSTGKPSASEVGKSVIRHTMERMRQSFPEGESDSEQASERSE